VRLPPGALNMVHVLPVELRWDDPTTVGEILARALDKTADGST
jgi:hypothetical protein